VVFRKENKVDAFQRQISALRHQLGPDGEQGDADTVARGDQGGYGEGDQRRDGDVYGERDGSGYGFDAFGAGEAELTPATGFDQGPGEVSPSLPAIPAVDAQTSVVAHDAVWKGELETAGSIHVHGRLEGGITSKQDVFVAEEATVDATIAAVNVIVAGRVTGSIRCQGRFEALPQGRIAAEVQAPSLVVHEGASITGGFRMGAAEPEATAAAEPPPPVVHRRAARSGS